MAFFMQLDWMTFGFAVLGLLCLGAGMVLRSGVAFVAAALCATHVAMGALHAWRGTDATTWLAGTNFTLGVLVTALLCVLALAKQRGVPKAG